MQLFKVSTLILLFLTMLGAAEDYIYHDYTAMTKFLQTLAKNHSDLVTMESQGETLGKRQLWSITMSAGDPQKKPALLIVGGVEGTDLTGSELCLYYINTLVTQYGKVDSVTQLLKNTTFYIFPRINPDASENFFAPLKYEKRLNNRQTDLDKDGSSDEDGYDDLNSDGLISMMRITDPAGDWLPDKEIPQLLRQADRAKGEKGVYRLFTEGMDNDKDGQWNEDEPGGVNFNQNFSYNYKFFSHGAGTYQLSDIESNSVVRFAFSHPNIAAVFSYSPNDNLLHPWKAQEDDKAGSTPPEKHLTGVRPNDAAYYHQISDKFKTITAFTDAPEPPAGEGAFNEWAYYHFCRWSFSVPAWWPPLIKEPADTSQADTSQVDTSQVGATIEQKKEIPKEVKQQEERDPIAGQRRLWKWLETTGQSNAFIPWKEVTHPDFPLDKVEVGGFAPYSGIIPPVDSIKTLSKKYSDFLLHLATLLPHITINKIKVEPLHDNIFRLQVFVTNNGFLPTNTDLGLHSKWNPKIKLMLTPGKDQQLLDKKAIQLIDTIAGSGSTIERSWVIMGKKGSKITVSVENPMAGSDEKSVVLE